MGICHCSFCGFACENDDDLGHAYCDKVLNVSQDLTASWDFVDNDNDPTPDYSTNEPNSHGTSCAGEVGMARDNGVCGAGVAYDCNIGGELQTELTHSTLTRNDYPCKFTPTL